MRLSVIRGFTLIEIMVATLMLALFFLFYLEWMTARTTQSRHLGLLSQFEHVRRAILAYADHSRLGLQVDQKTLDENTSGWPSDNNAGDGSGILKLFNAGHLAPTFASVFPGSRWLLIEQKSNKATQSSWLKVRYETPADYGLGEQLMHIQQALDYWSAYMDGTPDNPNDADQAAAAKCQSLELSDKKCDAIEFYVLSGPAPLPLTTTVESLYRYLNRSAKDHFIHRDVRAVDMKGASMHRLRRLIVGGRPGTPYRLQNDVKYVYEKEAELSGSRYNTFLSRKYFHSDADTDLKRLKSLPYSLNLAGFDDQVDEWNEMIGETYEYGESIPEDAIMDYFAVPRTEEGAPKWSTPSKKGPSGYDWTYLIRVSGLYADNLHLGGTWTSALESSGSILEMPVGTSFLSFLWAGRDAPRWNSWWYDPATTTVRTHIGATRPAYADQPYYDKSEQKFKAAPVGSIMAREITAVNIGLAAFNKAIMGDYGIYTSNLSLGERSLVVYKPTTTSLLSYFTEFRFHNVKIFQSHNVQYTGRGAGTPSQIKADSHGNAYKNGSVHTADKVTWTREGAYNYNINTTWTLSFNGRSLDDTIRCKNTQKGLIDKDVLNFIASECTGYYVHVHNSYNKLLDTDRTNKIQYYSFSGSSGATQPAPDRWHPTHRPPDPPDTSSQYRPEPEIGLMSGLLRRSDARLKRNIRPLPVRPGALAGISAYSYQNLDSTSNSPSHLGFVAQEVNNHYPELVEQDAKGHLSMSYDGMVPVLWGHLQDAVKTLDERSSTLEEKLALLEEQMRQQKEISEN